MFFNLIKRNNYKKIFKTLMLIFVVIGVIEMITKHFYVSGIDLFIYTFLIYSYVDQKFNEDPVYMERNDERAIQLKLKAGNLTNTISLIVVYFISGLSASYFHNPNYAFAGLLFVVCNVLFKIAVFNSYLRKDE